MKVDLSIYKRTLEIYKEDLRILGLVLNGEEIQDARDSLKKAEKLLEKRCASEKDELEILDLIGEAEEIVDMFSEELARAKLSETVMLGDYGICEGFI